MSKLRVPLTHKMKAELQKEINSECPFCGSDEVGCFETHHIDGDPSNSKDRQNLIRMCPTCHAKIERGDIPYEAVIKKKADLANRSWKVEFVSVTTDVQLCGWSAVPENEFAFFQNEERQPRNPILNLTFINHLSRTVVLKEISVKAKWLPKGISGIEQEPKVLTPLAKYYITISGNDGNILRLTNPLEVPTGRAFLFQVEIYPIDGRMATYFTFKFSDSISVNTPPICFNCNDENEQMTIRMVGWDSQPISKQPPFRWS